MQNNNESVEAQREKAASTVHCAWARWAGLLFGGLWLALIGSQVWSCSVISDQFECGTRQDGNRTLAKLCDGAGQVCVCAATHRCAEPNSACTSGLKFVFGKRECVNSSLASAVISQSDAAHGFCPGDGPPCGQQNGSSCAKDQVCACSIQHCAKFAGDCATLYRDVQTNECLTGEAARPEALLFNSDVDAVGVCQQFQPLAAPCGLSRNGKDAVRCPMGNRCVCAGARFQCAHETLSQACESGYVWQQDARCVTDLTRTQIEDPKNQVNDKGFCPGANGGSGGGTSEAGAVGQGNAGSAGAGAGGAGQ